MQQCSNGYEATKEETTSTDLSELKEALEALVDQGCVVLSKLSKQSVEIGEVVIQKAAENGKKAAYKCIVSAKEHPIAALLVAVGLGFFVVKFLKRK